MRQFELKKCFKVTNCNLGHFTINFPVHLAQLKISRHISGLHEIFITLEQQ